MPVAGAPTRGPHSYTLEGRPAYRHGLPLKHQMVGFIPTLQSEWKEQPPTYPFGPTAADTKGSSSSAPNADEGVGCLYNGVKMYENVPLSVQWGMTTLYSTPIADALVQR